MIDARVGTDRAETGEKAGVRSDHFTEAVILGVIDRHLGTMKPVM